MHFRPPAKALLAHLPSGTKLTLVREPENPYDENAVAVFCAPAQDIPASEHAALDGELAEYGTDWDSVAAESAVHLGYLAATGGKPLAGTGYSGNSEWLSPGGPIGDGPCEAELHFDAEGRATLRGLAAA